MRLHVEEQEQDARIVLADDGATVVIVKRGLLSGRAEAVVRRVLHVLDNPSQVVPYPGELHLGDAVDEVT